MNIPGYAVALGVGIVPVLMWAAYEFGRNIEAQKWYGKINETLDKVEEQRKLGN